MYLINSFSSHEKIVNHCQFVDVLNPFIGCQPCKLKQK